METWIAALRYRWRLRVARRVSAETVEARAARLVRVAETMATEAETAGNPRRAARLAEVAERLSLISNNKQESEE